MSLTDINETKALEECPTPEFEPAPPTVSITA